MNKKFGVFILLGMLLCGSFGTSLGAANGIPFWGLILGVLSGLFIGWFIAAAVIEIENSNRK